MREMKKELETLKKEKRCAEVEQKRFKVLKNRVEKLRKKIRKIRMRDKVQAVIACKSRERAKEYWDESESGHKSDHVAIGCRIQLKKVVCLQRKRKQKREKLSRSWPRSDHGSFGIG